MNTYYLRRALPSAVRVVLALTVAAALLGASNVLAACSSSMGLECFNADGAPTTCDQVHTDSGTDGATVSDGGSSE